MPRIRLEAGQFGWGFLLVRAWRDVEERDTMLVQSDWEYPGVAATFGWSPCHPDTDGTINCRECGKTAGELIASAGRFLARHVGRVREDPGYLPGN